MLHYRVLALATSVLGLAVLVAGGAFFQGPGVAVRTASSEEKLSQTIVVGGEGTIYAEPDMAYVQLGVQTTASAAQAAQQSNADQMRKVIDQLLALNIDRKDIRTSGVSLYPIFDRRDGKSQVPTGYQASNQVSVNVRDLKKVAAVLDTAVAAGANTMGGVSFGIQDDSRLRQEALSKAVESAKAKAEAVAKTMGVRILGIQSVAEDGLSMPQPLFDMSRSAAPSTAEATPVMPGQLTIVGHVRVAFTY